jgi:hypothetical protein
MNSAPGVYLFLHPGFPTSSYSGLSVTAVKQKGHSINLQVILPRSALSIKDRINLLDSKCYIMLEYPSSYTLHSPVFNYIHLATTSEVCNMSWGYVKISVIKKKEALQIIKDNIPFFLVFFKKCVGHGHKRT